jgi:glutaredoxin
MSGCEKCELLSSELQTKDIAHRVFNINDDPLLYKQFMAFINDDLTKDTRIKFPVIWNKDHTIFGFNAIENIVKELQ